MIIYLYVKQHTVTGLKYFGVTRASNPFKYNGSGVYWKKHISKHGRCQVKTLEIWGFDDPVLCQEFAIKFSIENNIVTSKEWANQIIEDGTGHTNLSGYAHTKDTKDRISESVKNTFWWNDGIHQTRSLHKPADNWVSGRLPFTRSSPTIETCQKMSLSNTGKTPPNKGIPMKESQKQLLSSKLSGGVTCIDITNGIRYRVSKKEFDANPNLVGSSSKIGLASISINHSNPTAAL